MMNFAIEAIVAASFGTSHSDTAPKTIGAVEEAIRAACPQQQVVRAYTSSMMRRALARRGEVIPSPQEALVSLAAEGVRRVCVLPTHFIPGEEYEKLHREAAALAPQFDRLTIAKPLLDTAEDCRRMVKLLLEAMPHGEHEAVCWMGHGSPHPANCRYQQLAKLLHQADEHCFLATVDGAPTFDEVLPKLLASGCHTVHLLPMMLVAGDHAKNDMTGDTPESWKSRLEAAGVDTVAHLQGLGEQPALRAWYLDRLQQACGEWQ